VACIFNINIGLGCTSTARFPLRSMREEGGWIEFSYLHMRARWLREILDLVSDKVIDFGRVLQMSMLEFVGCAPSAAYIEIEGVW